MEALYDRTGRVYAWLYEGEKIYGLNGANLALITDDSVYAWNGAHIGWWRDGHIRDRFGAVALFTADAESLGVARPARSARPAVPARSASPAKPARSARPARPAKQVAWSSAMPF